MAQISPCTFLRFILLLTCSHFVTSSPVTCPRFSSCVTPQDCAPDKQVKTHTATNSQQAGTLSCPLSQTGRSPGVCCFGSHPDDVPSQATSEEDNTNVRSSRQPHPHKSGETESFTAKIVQHDVYASDEFKHKRNAFDDAVPHDQHIEPVHEDPRTLPMARAFEPSTSEEEEESQLGQPLQGRAGGYKGGSYGGGYGQQSYKNYQEYQSQKMSSYKGQGYGAGGYQKYSKAAGYIGKGYEPPAEGEEAEEEVGEEGEYGSGSNKYYGSTTDYENDPWTPFILGCVSRCIYAKNAQLYQRPYGASYGGGYGGNGYGGGYGGGGYGGGYGGGGYGGGYGSGGGYGGGYGSGGYGGGYGGGGNGVGYGGGYGGGHGY